MASQQLAYYASSGSVEWYTPAYLVQAVLAVLGAVDCDPCSNPAPFNVPAFVHYTQADDGLIQPWAGRVYCNPPFGSGIGAWLRKLETERAIGRCTEAIVLTPGRTEARWFQAVWRADAICFVLGRVQFIGGKQSGNTTGTVLAYFGPAPDRFAAVFAQYGQIIFPPAAPRVGAIQPTLWETP